MEDIRRVHQFRLEVKDVPLAADAQEGSDVVLLKIGGDNKRISCRVATAQITRISSAFAQMVEIDAEKSPYQHARLKGAGRLELKPSTLEIEIDPTTDPYQVCFKDGSVMVWLNRVDGSIFSELALFFSDIQKALKGEAVALEEHDDSLGPRSRPSSLADSD
jgi:hypothetical protein